MSSDAEDKSGLQAAAPEAVPLPPAATAAAAGEKTPESLAPPKRRPAVPGLIPLFFVALFTIFWFYRHLYPYLEPRLGTTQANLLAVLLIALAAIIKFFRFLFPKADEKLPPIVLRSVQRISPSYLWTLAIVLLVAVPCTTSICISQKGGDGEFKVNLEMDGKPWGEAMELSAHEPTRIRFTLSRLKARKLSVKAVDVGTARRYPTFQEDMTTGRAVQIYVPGDLSPQLHLVSLVPWLGLIENLPPTSSPREASDPCLEPQQLMRDAARRGPNDFRYRLSCSVNGNTYVINDWRQQAIYLGADREALEWALESEKPSDRATRLPAGSPSNSTASQAIGLLSNNTPCKLPTLELRGGEKLHISVFAVSQNVPEEVIIKERTLTVATAPGIQTLLVGKAP